MQGSNMHINMELCKNFLQDIEKYGARIFIKKALQ
jgi:hypothetical protein